jgi:16S rRNA G966 N2-methylase RsmD
MKRFPFKPLYEAVPPSKQKARRHYGSHPYFTKRAWNVVQAYIQHFSAPGDTVLDPFGGSGVTCVESLVLRRKGVYVDISDWATFLARQTALAPVNLRQLCESFAAIEERCRSYLEELWRTPNRELEKLPVTDWYPKGVLLPGNSDVPTVEELFTPRMLHGLARLRACIMECRDQTLRDLLRMAFSATLARINRTFLSAANRRESRGGSAIFSIYRYKVAKRPVELPLWPQFAKRFDRLLEAKEETNQLIGDFYKEGDTAVFWHGSATRLLDVLKPGSIDYIYTDPPYGGHIAYLDLSTMWAAWLGFDIRPEDRSDEVIEGGSLRKSREAYQSLLAASLQQMHETLKSGAWLSVVFAHRDTTYWESIVKAAQDAGLRYVNTVSQPVGVVWSMHKKKNPLSVLSGELVINFRKAAGGTKITTPAAEQETDLIVRQCCEREILGSIGATTEAIHHVLVPALLEAGLLKHFSRKHGDITPLLKQFFDFESDTGRWQLRNDARPVASLPKKQMVRYFIARLLSRRGLEGKSVTEAEVRKHVQTSLNNGAAISNKTVRLVLKKVAHSPDNRHWIPLERGGQRTLF